MPDLSFRVEDAAPEPYSAAPVLNFKLRIANADPAETIQSVMLRCQIRIEPAGRRYTSGEQDHLLDLFGTPERWGQTLRSMLWTHVNVVVLPFQAGTCIDLPVPCSFDLAVACSKYFNGLEDGEVPLTLLFSGTVFHEDPDGALRIVQIPWTKEAAYRMPVSVWKDMIDRYYPNTAWLCLRRDVFERLHQYKVAHGIPTWEQTVESILP